MINQCNPGIIIYYVQYADLYDQQFFSSRGLAEADIHARSYLTNPMPHDKTEINIT